MCCLVEGDAYSDLSVSGAALVWGPVLIWGNLVNDKIGEKIT